MKSYLITITVPIPAKSDKHADSIAKRLLDALGKYGYGAHASFEEQDDGAGVPRTATGDVRPSQSAGMGHMGKSVIRACRGSGMTGHARPSRVRRYLGWEGRYPAASGALVGLLIAAPIFYWLVFRV